MADAPEIHLRQHPRAGVAREISILFEGRSAPLRAVLVDVSVAGLGIACAEPLPEGASVAFELDAEAGAVSGEGKVVWSHGQRRDRPDMATLGVRIVALGQAGFERLDGLVERYLRRRPAIPATVPVVLSSAEDEGASAAAPGAGEAAPDDPLIVEGTPLDKLPSATAEATPSTAPPALSLPPLEKPSASTPPVETPPPDLAAPPAPLPDRGSASVHREQPRFQRYFVAGFVALLLAVAAGLVLGPRFARQRVAEIGAEAGTPGEAAGPEPAIGGEEPSDLPVSAPVQAPAPGPILRPEPTVEPPAPATEVAQEAPTEARPSPAAVRAAQRPGFDLVPPEAIRSITAERSSGGTRLEIRGDRPIADEHVFAALIGPDPPRYLLRISGVRQRYSASRVSIGTDELLGVRTGLHDTVRGPELHIVVDLTTRDLDIEVGHDAGALVIDFDAAP